MRRGEDFNESGGRSSKCTNESGGRNQNELDESGGRQFCVSGGRDSFLI